MTAQYDPQTVTGIFMHQAAKYGDRPLHTRKQDGRWVTDSWRHAAEGGRATALGLVALGVKKGDPVAIASQTRVEWTTADFGTLLAGGVVVAIYPTSTVEQVRYIVGHSEARIAFVEDDAQLDKVLAVREAIGLPEQIVVFETRREMLPAGTMTLVELQDRGRALDAKRPGLFEKTWRAVGPDDLATIAYTSGTTGPPKGVMITHGNLFHTAVNASSAHHYEESDFGVAFLPLTHLFQRFSVYAAIHLGMQGAFAQSIDTLIDDMQELRPTVQLAVPRIFEKMYVRIHERVDAGPPIARKIFRWAVDVGRRSAPYRKNRVPMPPLLAAEYALAERLVFRKIRNVLGGRIRYLISGSAPISVELLEFFYAVGLLVLEGYGLTETVAPATVNRVENFKFGTVGQLIPGMEAKIAPEDGEILMRGKGLFRGYFKDPEATAEAIDPDGWFHTGDIGTIDEEGFITITDRKKDLIITAGGKNISPQNIENLLKGSPLVSQAMVYGDRRKYLTALITLDEEELRLLDGKEGFSFTTLAAAAQDPIIHRRIADHVAAVNRELARYETIKDFRILDRDFTQAEGEITPTLKIRRKEITKRYKDLLDSMYDETFD